MSAVDLVAITQALREAAEQIRALPDGELVAMALRAQTSEAGRSPAGAVAGRDASPALVGPRTNSRRAEAPKSPAPTPAPRADAEEVPERGARPQRGLEARVRQALEALSSHGPLTRDQLTSTIGIARTGSNVNAIFARLREHPRVEPPQSKGKPWSLR